MNHIFIYKFQFLIKMTISYFSFHVSSIQNHKYLRQINHMMLPTSENSKTFINI